MTKEQILKESLEWIADNDEPNLSAIEDIENLMTVTLIADVFGYSRRNVAQRVATIRKWENP